MIRQRGMLPWWRWLTILALAGALGCSLPRRLPSPPVGEGGLLRAWFSGKLVEPERKIRWRGRVAGDPAGRFRIEVQDPLGRVVARLGFDGLSLTVLLPQEGIFARGEVPAGLDLVGCRPVWRLLQRARRIREEGPPGPARWERHLEQGRLELEVRRLEVVGASEAAELLRPISDGGCRRIGLADALDPGWVELLESLGCPGDR